MGMRETADEIYRTLCPDQAIPLPANYVAKVATGSPKLPADLSGVPMTHEHYSAKCFR